MVQIVVAIFFVAPQLTNTFLISHYYFNWQQIEAKYCINQGEDNIDCKGICHVNQQININGQLPNWPAQPEFPDCEITLFIDVYNINLSLINDRLSVSKFRINSQDQFVLARLDRPPCEALLPLSRIV